MKDKPITIIMGRGSELSFPAGMVKDGGSCEFATATCLRFCKLQKTSIEKNAIKVLQKCQTEDIVRKIKKELIKDRSKLLHWFGSGDCPTALTDKVFSIIKRLDRDGVPQNGFTRNQQLWQLMSKTKIPFALSVDNKKVALKMQHIGLVSNPNYDQWSVDLMYKNQQTYLCGGGGGCGEGNLEVSGEIYPEDCQECWENRRGCFGFKLAA